MNEHDIVEKGELGKATPVIYNYDNSLLFPISRKEKRDEIDYNASIQGIDLWTCYEVSWLDQTGKPCVTVITLNYQSSSEYIIESKSLKLYLNSLNFTKFTSKKDVFDLIRTDVSASLN
jgi:7-cyano-7-deazaguanine reductase